jgi:hypothetical protein
MANWQPFFLTVLTIVETSAALAGAKKQAGWISWICPAQYGLVVALS